MYQKIAIATCSGALLICGLVALAFGGHPAVPDIALPLTQALAVVGPHVEPEFVLDELPAASPEELQRRAEDFAAAGRAFTASLEFFRAADRALAEGRRELHAVLMGEHGRALLALGDLRGAHWAAALADERLEALEQEGSGAETRAARAHIWLLLAEVEKAAGRYEESGVHVHEALAFFEKVGHSDGVARAHAVDCDRLQLERHLDLAREACTRALRAQPVGHPDRAATEKTLGMVEYFSQELQRAAGLFAQASAHFTALGRPRDADLVREMSIDDQAAILEAAAAKPEAYAPLITELTTLVQRLEESPEVLWWRVSDAQLRLADLLRRAGRAEDAQRAWQESLAAFHRRPAGYENVPDYATLFEFQGLLARDRGDLASAQAALAESQAVLERIVGAANADVQILAQEILALNAALEA